MACQERNALLPLYTQHPATQSLCAALAAHPGSHLRVKGLSGSSRALAVAAANRIAGRSALVVMADREEAAYLLNDLAGLLGDSEVYFFPSSYKRSPIFGQIQPDAVIQRTDTLNALNPKNASRPTAPVIVTYPDALVERVVPLGHLQDHSLRLSVGERVSPEFIEELLQELGFERVEFVYEPGQYAARGSIIDIFSFAEANPFRVDFFGDEVESIRSFDVNDQRSKAEHPRVAIIPHLKTQSLQGPGCFLGELLPGHTVVWVRDVEVVLARMNEIYRQVETEIPSQVDHYAPGSRLFEFMQGHGIVEFGVKQHFRPCATIGFATTPQPSFQKNFELLAKTIAQRADEGYQTYIMAHNPTQHERLTRIFASTPHPVAYTALNHSLHEGFLDNTLRICVFTDHQLFERYHRPQLKHELARRDSLSIQELINLQPGDFVVHADHGIGRFGGLVATAVNGKRQEAVRLIYKDNDTLLVNIHALHRIAKYRGKDTEPPRVYKLGSGAWQKLKGHTKRKVKDIARELIALYAKRREEKGHAFAPDCYLQAELEASFVFEDTPDQMKATQAVKEDMQSPVPMDRLVCGDVGFGKTEVAIRAAFKAVADSKQVAVLVPTTILALQHYQTFRQRLAGLPCRVEFVSRMKSAKAQKEVLKALAEGRVDILIGTHALLGRGVKFRDLGLLIVDEEQKFGVAAKEKLKSLRVNVDTLTLTATPIPRTLQFSLMGARDLSIINTPPANRHPIATELHTFHTAIIKEAIEQEVARGGQVYFVHNRVQSIGEVQRMVAALCPRVSTTVGHGQMDPAELEDIMVRFIAGEYDVLISTAIIESGLDIPNANTIIINDAQNFGLSDLHQLRGRVGRTNRKAFCYLLAPPLETLTPEARRRLKAIEEFSELGSGFSIAMQDMDIRGAGNLLGAEQSGFIADIGLETYQRILDEAIQELREEEFAHLFAPAGTAPTQEQWQPTRADCQVETDLEILFPPDFINSVPERMRLYRELDSLRTADELAAFEAMLRDRFGPLPSPAQELLRVVELRAVAIGLGLERIVLKNQTLSAQFIASPSSPFYRSDTFGEILGHIQRFPNQLQLREVKGRLILTAKNIENLSTAINQLKQIQVSPVCC